MYGMSATTIPIAFQVALCARGRIERPSSHLQIFKRVGPAAVRLLLIPGIVEAFFDGGLAIALFGMPVTFAFALGFILKAVGPALVIQCMFEVQQRRLGLEKAIPATVVAAASFDGAFLTCRFNDQCPASVDLPSPPVPNLFISLHAMLTG